MNEQVSTAGGSREITKDVEPVDKSRLMTIAAFAKAAGVSRQTIYNRLDKDLTRYLTEVDSVKYLDRAALQLFVSNLDSQIDKEFDTDLTAYLTTIDILKHEVEMLQGQLTVKDEQISFLQEQAAGQLQSIQDLTAALKQQQALTAGTLLLTEVSTQSGAAPGEILEGERETVSTVEARMKQETNEGAAAPSDGMSTSDPAKKKSLLSIIFGKRGKRK